MPDAIQPGPRDFEVNIDEMIALKPGMKYIDIDTQLHAAAMRTFHWLSTQVACKDKVVITYAGGEDVHVDCPEGTEVLAVEDIHKTIVNDVTGDRFREHHLRIFIRRPVGWVDASTPPVERLESDAGSAASDKRLSDGAVDRDHRAGLVDPGLEDQRVPPGLHLDLREHRRPCSGLASSARRVQAGG